MKTYKVYEIINSMGTVEWVGETSRDLNKRFYEHKQRPTSPGKGTFHGRNDVSIHLVTTFDNRPDARQLERQLKSEYGLEYTEGTGGKLTGAENGRKSQIQFRTCPYCNKTIKGTIYFRFHGDNCKNKI